MFTPEAKFLLLNAYLALDPNLGRQETLATKDNIGEEDWLPYLIESLPEYVGPSLKEPSIDGPILGVRRLTRRFIQRSGEGDNITTKRTDRRRAGRVKWTKILDLRPRSVLLAASLGNPFDELSGDGDIESILTQLPLHLQT